MNGGGFINEAQAQGIRDLPIIQPQIVLRRSSSVVIAQVKLEAGERLELKWLGMQVLQLTTNDDDTKLTDSRRAVYVGLFSGMEGVERPAGVPIMRVGTDIPTLKAINPYYAREFATPDTYKIILVNNTLGNDYDVVVTGVMRLLKDA